MATNLPHLVITDFEQEPFTGTGGGNGKPRPVRNRTGHSIFLHQQLQQAWVDAENDAIVYHSQRNGVYLEFKGEQGYELVTKSLENLRGTNQENWTRLLNVRKESVPVVGEAEAVEVVFATIYVPNSKRELLFNQIERYATEDNARSGQPKNANLLESISDIRKALEVESFWQDAKDLMPTDEPQWCEVWLSSDQEEVVQRFKALLDEQQINYKSGEVRFPERTVKVIHANRNQLESITRLSDDIAEYRRAKETATFWLDQENKEQAEWVENILERLEVPQDAGVAICILDTGVNNGHPLLAPCLQDEDCQTVHPDWGSHDHDMHGTLMAGVSAYGNLQDILTHTELIRLQHCLESIKILPPTGSTEPELWGYMTAQAVSKAVIQAADRKRITCMAVTADDTRDQGRPSSWSAELDQICSGAEDDERKLFIVSAGNCNETRSLDECSDYPQTQLEESIHDPAQSWNALTVGAFTNLDHLSDPTLVGYEPIAPAGGLSPFSTTSLPWEDKWPIKPEVIMEGGNIAKSGSGFVTECDDLSVLSTFFDPQQAHFSPFNMTSAATAQAAWFAAQVQAEYPDYWPETIRALMVHSADWPEPLKQQFLDDESKASYKHLLRICGYGVPNLDKARFSASDSLTMIAQAELQPYAKKENGSGYCTNDMHFYELPWPQEALQSLPDDTMVQMRVTLSYFVEPGPGEIGWQDRYRYASHGLRFELNSPGEEKDHLLRRINAAARNEENGHPGTASAAEYWVLGQARDKGSIHSDIWQGYAFDLALSNMIAVYPTIGWWRERAHLGRWNKKTRYALIISITTPEQEVDIYTPVANQIGIAVPVEINV